MGSRMKGETQAQYDKRMRGYQAIWTVEAAVVKLVTDSGGKMVDRESSLGPDFPAIREPETAAGLAAAREVQVHLAGLVRKYIKRAREDGLTWRKIGELMGLEPKARAERCTLAEAAFTEAAGPESEGLWSLMYSRVFRWDCPECGRAIDDEGPQAHPSEVRQDRSHRAGCKRRAADQRAWHLNDKAGREKGL